MSRHIIGKEPFSGPSEEPTAFPSGNSLTLRLFMAAVRGEAAHVPSNPFRTESVAGEERYCLSCFGVRWHDVIKARTLNVGANFEVSICRCCGAEVTR